MGFVAIFSEYMYATIACASLSMDLAFQLVLYNDQLLIGLFGFIYGWESISLCFWLVNYDDGIYNSK